MTNKEITPEQMRCAIYEKACELSETKYNPELFANITLAINAQCLDIVAENLEGYMKSRDYTQFGLCIMNRIVSQLEEWAYEEAAFLYNSTLGGGDNQ